MDKDTRNIVTTAVAAVVTVALPFLRVHPLVALLFGVASFYVVRDIIPLTPQLEEEDVPQLPPRDQQAPEDPLAPAERSARRFHQLADSIAKQGTAATVREIAHLVERLVQDFREDPDDLRLPAAQTFLHTNLERALRLVESYARLSAMEFPVDADDSRSKDRQHSLREAEETIELTRQGFLALLTECQENDLREMNMDSHVLTQMLEDRFPQLVEAERRAMEQQPEPRSNQPKSDNNGNA